MSKNIINGIVVKVLEEQIVLMTEHGTFKNVPLSPLKQRPLLGEKFNYVEKRSSSLSWLKYASLASIFIIAIMVHMILPLRDNNTSFITVIDINPSIELLVNKDLQVIGVEGLNDDGAKIMAAIPSKGDLYAVIDRIIEQSILKGYINASEIGIVQTSIISVGDYQEISTTDVENIIIKALQKNNAKAEVVVISENMDNYRVAKSENLSINHYQFYKELKSKGVIDNARDIKGMTVRELKGMIKGATNNPGGNKPSIPDEKSPAPKGPNDIPPRVDPGIVPPKNTHPNDASSKDESSKDESPVTDTEDDSSQTDPESQRPQEAPREASSAPDRRAPGNVESLSDEMSNAPRLPNRM